MADAPASKKSPGLVPAPEGLLRDATAGDPISGPKWTHESTRALSRALRRLGYAIGPDTVGRLLHAHDFSLRTNRKRLAGTRDPDRDRQFRYLTRMRRLDLARGRPVISVDTKKKELVGNFKDLGRTWRQPPRDVLDHDFPSWASGQGIPYGIDDEAHNDGHVVIGTSHETPDFAVAAIRRWWRTAGRSRYPGAERLLIRADGGGANDPRKGTWTVALQRLADKLRLIITVTHYPPGASKWNRIEHRMVSLISEDWAGEPPVSYEVMLKSIRTTRSASGFHCRACLDRRAYPTKVKVSKEQTEGVRLRRRKVLPKWNYTIWPHRPSPE